jgi:hypothetical protein
LSGERTGALDALRELLARDAMRHLSMGQFRRTAHMPLHEGAPALTGEQQAHAAYAENPGRSSAKRRYMVSMHIVDRDAKCFPCAGT